MFALRCGAAVSLAALSMLLGSCRGSSAPAFPNDPRFQRYLWPSPEGSGGALATFPASPSAPPPLPRNERLQVVITEKPLHGAPHPNSVALVIGVESYGDGLTHPVGARRDAESFAELAEHSFGVPADQVHVLLDEQATRSRIERQIAWAADNVQPPGTLFFFFAGHGSVDHSEARQGPAQFLLPHDVTPSDVHGSGLELGEILARLKISKAAHVVAFLDACYAAGGGRSVPTRTRGFVREHDAPDRTLVFSASTASQVAGPTARGDAGAFTHALTEALSRGGSSALADLDGDGNVSMIELRDWVTPRVARESAAQSREQTPTLTLPMNRKDMTMILAEGLNR
jgi:uncharacterized caspase-like protein